MIGAKDQQITLQRFMRTPDGAGGSTESWVSFTSDPTPWANVKAKGGREGLVEGRTTATFVVVFTIYNRADVTELDRILWNGAAYNIRGILRQGERAIDLMIEAERGVSP